MKNCAFTTPYQVSSRSEPNGYGTPCCVYGHFGAFLLGADARAWAGALGQAGQEQG